MKNQILKPLAIALMLVLVPLSITTAQSTQSTQSTQTNQGSKGDRGIAPIQSNPHDHSYMEWAAKWWQWALGQPASVNPVTDSNGEFCSKGQLGAVWFLAGTLGDPAHTERYCTIPSGQAIFFPVINQGYFAFLNDPKNTRTPTFIRSQVDCTVDSVKVIIDNNSVKKPQQYFLDSKKALLFDVELPSQDNLFGATLYDIPELILSPSATSGIFLFLSPLSPGSHTLHWEASQTCPSGVYSQDVTYTLSVQSPPQATPASNATSNAFGTAAPIGNGRHIP